MSTLLRCRNRAAPGGSILRLMPSLASPYTLRLAARNSGAECVNVAGAASTTPLDVTSTRCEQPGNEPFHSASWVDRGSVHALAPGSTSDGNTRIGPYLERGRERGREREREGERFSLRQT
ncbi:hypothetical protein Q8A73_021856 [Channa argus]|nr:hypothetical protein Q8A73_021856 [Channa argus]